MIQKVKNVLKRRKVKLFSLFLLLSGLAWFISNLSLRYESKAIFELEFVNPPDSMMMLSASHKEIEVQLDAVGFQFLAFGLGKKKVNINLSEAKRIGSKYVVGPSSLQSQIAQQLSSGVKLVRTNADSIVIKFYGVTSRKVPVKTQLKLQFAQNYVLDGSLVIRPDSIIIKGPINEIDTIRHLRTALTALENVNADFSVSSPLIQSNQLKKTWYSESEVVLIGKVTRFSEKIISVPISMINLPENTEAQTFPNVVNVLIKASLANLKNVKTSDIKVVGDYTTVNTDNKTVLLRIVNQPNTIHSAELSRNYVDFILKRE